MPTDRRLHLFEAITASAHISKEQPKTASLNFWLSNGEAVTVVLPRHLLENLRPKIERALLKAPFPARRRLGRPSATSRNK
jgi:hypothetical protein